MNTNDKNDIIDNGTIDSREWQAQERAMRDAREGVASTDPMALRYRKVAHALRAPLPDLLPADFAAQVARRAEHNATAPAIASVDVQQDVESRLLRYAVGVLGLGSAVVAAMYGRQWLAPTMELLHLESAVAVNWALALAACVGVSWLTDWLRRHREAARVA
jgi:hypothetical protein